MTGAAPTRVRYCRVNYFRATPNSQDTSCGQARVKSTHLNIPRPLNKGTLSPLPPQPFLLFPCTNYTHCRIALCTCPGESFSIIIVFSIWSSVLLSLDYPPLRGAVCGALRAVPTPCGVILIITLHYYQRIPRLVIYHRFMLNFCVFLRTLTCPNLCSTRRSIYFDLFVLPFLYCVPIV